LQKMQCDDVIYGFLSDDAFADVCVFGPRVR
jgi:hypothetical protein